MSTEKLIKDYKKACNNLVNKFATKQNLDFDGWVTDEVGGIACFASQYFFHMSDIELDLSTNQKKGFILEWIDDGTEFNMDILLTEEGARYINYASYIAGLRYENLK